MYRFAILLLAGLALAACSKEHDPPTGRWIGHYESPTVMVVAWLEILPGGFVDRDRMVVDRPARHGQVLPVGQQRSAEHLAQVRDARRDELRQWVVSFWHNFPFYKRLRFQREWRKWANVAKIFAY